MSTTTDYLVTKSGLVARGWTEGLIKKHLGEPDELKTNPHYKSGPPMCLYSMSRVEPFEKEAWFLEAKSKRATRSAAALKIADRKRTVLLQWVERLKIKIPVMPLERLLKKACEHYNNFHEFSKAASLKDSPEFLSRIARNYIRHELTDYEARLEELFGKVGTEQAYDRLKTRINEAISEVYPHGAEKASPATYSRLSLMANVFVNFSANLLI
jgi:hypothetical protein